MAEINEMEEEFKKLNQIRDSLWLERHIKTPTLKSIKYFTMAGIVFSQIKDEPFYDEADYSNLPLKMVAQSYNKLFKAETPRTSREKAHDILSFLFDLVFAVVTSPIWIGDNLVCGSIYLFRKGIQKSHINTMDKTLTMLENQIKTMREEIQNQTKLVELAKSFKNNSKKIPQFEVKATKQTAKSEENGQGK